jgi:hypothetical protein
MTISLWTLVYGILSSKALIGHRCILSLPAPTVSHCVSKFTNEYAGLSPVSARTYRGGFGHFSRWPISVRAIVARL